MSNKVIVVWGTTITMIICAIYVIGIKYKSEIKYINLKEEVKESVKEYIKDKDVTLPFTITTEELETDGYIGQLKLDEKICAADIKVTKKVLSYNYDIDFTCINPTKTDI